MSKKKMKPNGFFIFMREMQQHFKEQQGRLIPMKNMTTMASPKWAELSEAEKQAYHKLAKDERGMTNDRYVHPEAPPLSVGYSGRMDCTGELISDRQDPAVELAEKRKDQGEVIKHSLTPGKAVIKQNFYFINFQSLCEMSIKNNLEYLPCEVALVEFSLVSGINRTNHAFIDPGKIPLGFRYLAQSTSDATHQIPVSGFVMAEKDYRKILGDIEHFLDPNWTEVMPPIYTKREHVKQCERCLDWLAVKAGVRNRLNKVYEIEALFCELSGHLTGRPIGFFQAEELLRTSVYDYSSGTRCGYHEEKEIPYCSLAAVNICAYVASETLGPEYGISLGASHMPPISAGACSQTKFTTKTQSEEIAQDPYDDRIYGDDSDDDSDDDPYPALGQPVLRPPVNAPPQNPKPFSYASAAGRPTGRGRGLLRLMNSEVGGMNRKH